MTPSAICFGEILFDVFENERHIGGAPFNFAAHFAQLGGDAYMVSAVGDDDLGQEAKGFLDRYGVKRDYVATLPNVSTGRCDVTTVNGTPEYDLKTDVAYDRIPVPILKEEYDTVCFGTLSQRSPDSVLALDAILKTKAAREVFFDVNIRKTSCGADRINELLGYTTVLKFSREEAGVFGEGSNEDICRELAGRYRNIKLIVVTLDKDGAFVYDTRKRMLFPGRRPQVKVVSTVGAGDGFSARFMFDYLRGESIPVCIENAIRLSEKICGQVGAI